MKTVAFGIAALVALAGTAMADDAVSYSTPNVPAIPSGVVASWGDTLTAASPVWRRAGQSANGSETAPNLPTALGSAGNYPYQVQSFTPTTSGLYQFYSAQAFDGYLHLYQNSFDPSQQLVNVLAGDDDMTSLNGGSVPNRNGVASTNDSGFQVNLTANTTYQIVTSTYSAAVPASGAFYNEIRGGGSPGSFTAIPDGNTTGVDLVLNIANANTITSLTSVNLFGLSHTWISDLTFTLTHNDTGTSVVILSSGGVSNNSDFGGGDYTIVDGGAALPGNGSGVIAAGSYGSANPLSAFVGESMGGTWTLHMVDGVGADVGGLFAFGISATVTPTPGTAALIGLGGLAALRRRRA